MTPNNGGTANRDTSVRHRPGPFGPARILLPEDQKIETIRDIETTASALERMVDTGFSQIPVVNEDGDIIGIFSWQSFGKRMSEIHSLNVDLSKLAVKDTDLARAQFIDPELFIDTETDWSEIDHVLVGDKQNLLGVLTITDVLGRLNDFAEAFVLLYEIEHEIRDLIVDVYPGGELSEVFEGLSRRSAGPEEAAAAGLKQLIEGDSPAISDKKLTKAIQFAANLLQRACQTRPVTDLKDFTFAQYREVIFNRDNWPRFEAVFDSPRDLLNMDFEKINDLRNTVFHFRRSITPRDTDRLRRFRDKLRYDRNLYNSKDRQLATSS
ncbi:CBS domain-containing protein [Alienimonas californiensis]|uniref:CBS domain protein n=1 Tax=Alienimonas californiensis TaxID=2527989 RepID=A0A517P5F8_9PLAN|nr:CBS domain-containing protein [Alienimonas californiensis]QDT14612.1 CBS domain protein [Alienimonas californiensis]